ncbi:hypothetical protein [Hoeflea prorocentri]|uniref:Uncharacterized protein n=1 Tax=Hoeflea prorocentri TaxID=1922333 RepID=A0A9X3UGR3_9HYPH|nr:hypothetical protein [Hoeflea prorocentri]MCY6380407.1 hypothetical protein [Hoeflea prorocentri]MDA5398207.1 hypothetical protein [Hoeflea prorocentri]
MNKLSARTLLSQSDLSPVEVLNADSRVPFLLLCEQRPRHPGLLSGTDLNAAQSLRDHISARRMDLNLAINQPNKIDPESDWFIPAHAEPRGLMHSLIEVRNDQLGDTAGVTVWADLLADAIQSTVEA